MIKITRIPYPCSGVITEPNKTTLCESAVVTAYNETKGEELNNTVTTNSAGEYIFDLCNLTTEYSNGDIIVLKATKGDKLKRYRFTVDTSVGYEEKNLILSYIDVLGLVKDLLTDGWQKGNTNNKTPKVIKIFDYKRQDISTLDNETWLSLYEVITLPERNSIGDLTRKLKHIVTVDIRSKVSREHAISVRNETDRIFGQNIIEAVEGYNIINPDGRSWKDLSDKLKNMQRFIMDIEIEKLNMSRASEYLE